MKLFGGRRRRKERYDKFISELDKQTDSYLFDGLDDLQMRYTSGDTDEYIQLKLLAVENELTKRGYADTMGCIITPRRYY